MSSEIIFVVEDSAEGGLEAKALGHSIFTEADTFEELKKNIKEAVSVHFDNGEMPKFIRLAPKMKISKEEVIKSIL